MSEIQDDKRFPTRGKWDFSDDAKRLEAIRLVETNSDWKGGHKEGLKLGKRLARQAWALPVSVAAVVIAGLASFTVLAIKRPDLLKFAEPLPAKIDMRMICSDGRFVWPSYDGNCWSAP